MVTPLEVLYILNRWMDVAEASDEINLSSFLVSETRLLILRLRKERDRASTDPSLTRIIQLPVDPR